MLTDPPINELMDKVDCRYTLVVLAAKRARQLVAGDAPLVEMDENAKPVSKAVREIYADKVTYDRIRRA